ncbi:hypothetical protein V8E36_005747 [Tilletia maclaganii]
MCLELSVVALACVVVDVDLGSVALARRTRLARDININIDARSSSRHTLHRRTTPQTDHKGRKGRNDFVVHFELLDCPCLAWVLVCDSTFGFQRKGTWAGNGQDPRSRACRTPGAEGRKGKREKQEAAAADAVRICARVGLRPKEGGGGGGENERNRPRVSREDYDLVERCWGGSREVCRKEQSVVCVEERMIDLPGSFVPSSKERWYVLRVPDRMGRLHMRMCCGVAGSYGY